MAKFIVVVVSLFYTIGISLIGGIPALLWGFTLYNYLSLVSIVLAVQLFVGTLYNSYISSKTRISNNKLESERLMAESIQNIEISCAYCGTKNSVPVIIGIDNKFECTTCRETNSVLLSCSAARTTNAVMPKREAADIFKSIDS